MERLTLRLRCFQRRLDDQQHGPFQFEAVQGLQLSASRGSLPVVPTEMPLAAVAPEQELSLSVQSVPDGLVEQPESPRTASPSDFHFVAYGSAVPALLEDAGSATASPDLKTSTASLTGRVSALMHYPVSPVCGHMGFVGGDRPLSLGRDCSLK